jgi:hypothetical protein
LGKDFFGQVFFISKDPLSDLSESVPKKDLKKLEEVFTIFTPYFNTLYKKDLPYLKAWKRELKEQMHADNLTPCLNPTLASLYHAKPLQANINIYLLFSTPKSSGGGAAADGKSITLEISRYPLKRVGEAIGIIWHELIHLYFERHYFFPLLRRKFPGDQEAVSLIKEAAASSLLPNGVLGSSILKLKAKRLHTRIPLKYNKSLLSLAEKYIRKGRFFDGDYAEITYSTVSKLKGILR